MLDIQFLKKHSLFGGIPDENLQTIIPLLQEKRYRKGENVICEGECDSHLYFIYKGSVEILKKPPSNCGDRLERIAVLGEGATFGEMELIDVQPRSATVRTLEDTVAFMFSSIDLHRIAKTDIQTFSFIIMNIAREISRRLRTMDDVVANFMFDNEQRLCNVPNPSETKT